MKAFKVKITVSKTVTFTEEEWKREGGIGGIDPFAVEMYAKGCLIEDLVNNPSRGTVTILEEYEL